MASRSVTHLNHLDTTCEKNEKNDGDFKFKSLDHRRCCDMDLCQQVHLCDSTLIWRDLKPMDDLLHRMWLAKNAKGWGNLYHGH